MIGSRPLAIGLLASIVGLLRSASASRPALHGLFKAFGADLPEQRDRASSRARSSSSLLVGTVVTIVARSRPRCGRRGCRRSRRCDEGAGAVRARPRAPVSRTLFTLAGVALMASACSPRRRAAQRARAWSARARRSCSSASRCSRPTSCGRSRRLIGRPIERRARRDRPAGPRERHPQPGPHGLDRRGAHDRRRARHLREHLRGRDQGLGRRRRRRQRFTGAFVVQNDRTGSPPIPAASAAAIAADPRRRARSRPASFARRRSRGVAGTQVQRRGSPRPSRTLFSFDWIEGSRRDAGPPGARPARRERRSSPDDHDLARRRRGSTRHDAAGPADRTARSAASTRTTAACSATSR